MSNHLSSKMLYRHLCQGRHFNAGNAVKEAELVMRDYSERILLSVATRYGKDSDEYEMAGGVRKSDRKRPIRKPKLAA
ncbi:hypothetical protein H6F75_09580 [Nodosilinea sp. FACHB-131]|uniref:hypothetical protein n=1 Tax=Cyanophyceae TaxID=3028117 RepID=UPI001687E8A0|nr:hypothetical protein [Nodosilinea sp. FACHB-131]MBD1873732.1 hypothetical protein [Nodosilinea sp. FACHB-131]